jgi:hypothetical protein
VGELASRAGGLGDRSFAQAGGEGRYLRAMQKSKEDYSRLIRQELDDIEKACSSPQLDALARNFLKRPRNRDGSALCDREFERDRDFYTLLLP